VVDSTDRDRLGEASGELQTILTDENLPEAAVLLVLANKQDLPRALSVAEVAELRGKGLYCLIRFGKTNLLVNAAELLALLAVPRYIHCLWSCYD
jgi:GTPase SAR1 family protein